MAKQKIINVHTHVHKNQDLDKRVKIWTDSGCVKVCVHVLARHANDRYFTNTEMAEVISAYPEIMLGFALPELGWKVPDASILDRYLEMGFAGLKFIAPSYAYDDERYFPLYDRARSLGMPILFHTGFLSVDSNQSKRGISQDKMRAVRLDTIARAFPDLRMMMAHLGNPEFDVGLNLIESFKNIWGEYSGDSGSKARLTAMKRAFAPPYDADMSDPEENLALGWYEKLCFATDNPDPPVWIDLNEKLMDYLQIPQTLRKRFYYDNAARWLDLKPD